MNRAQLRAAYADAVAARRPETRAACPPAETILALVRREGSEDQRIATLNHVLSCADCERELGLLRALERAGTMDTPTPRRAPWRRRLGIALAASVVLAVALGPARHLLEPERTVRGGTEPLAPIAPAADAVLPIAPASPPTFVWHAVPGAEGYTLELLTGEGALVASAKTKDTTLTLASPGALAPGEYQWSVTARESDGSELRSAARRLRVVR